MTTQETDLAHTILDIVEAEKPSSMLFIGEFCPAFINAYTSQEDIPLSTLSSAMLSETDDWLSLLSQAFVKLVLVDVRELDQDRSATLTLLGLLRNYLNARVLVVGYMEEPLDFQDYIGLGFKRALEGTSSEASKSLSLFTYDIGSYNRTRDWNNARYWANPEMFGKSFW